MNNSFMKCDNFKKLKGGSMSTKKSILLLVSLFIFLFISYEISATNIPTPLNLYVSTSNLDDIISELGIEPDVYIWGDNSYTYDTVPESMYVIQYLDSDVLELSFMIDGGNGHNITEMRIYSNNYYCLEDLTTGLTVDEVTAILGVPDSEVDGDSIDWNVKDTLYLNTDGTEGSHYYDNSEKGIRVFFTEDLSTGIFIYDENSQIIGIN